MVDRPAEQGQDERGVQIGRRGFIGAGLAGAGAALVVPASAAAARAHTGATQPAAAQAGAAQARAAQADSLTQARTAAATTIPHLPLHSIFPNLPAIPVDVIGTIETIARLTLRSEQIKQAKQGLTRMFTIRGVTDVAYAFLYGESAALRLAGDPSSSVSDMLQRDSQRAVSELLLKPIRQRGASQAPAASAAVAPPSLEHPEQFSLSWTTLPDVYHTGLPLLPAWSASLSDADSATQQFWPTIAEHGNGYNLIIPEKITGANADRARAHFGSAWNHEADASAAAGNLYMIDMSRFQVLQPQTVAGATRFTPSTVTLLTQDPQTKTLTPFAITVTGYRGQGRQAFIRGRATDGAWLYALQAAKTSITVFGVWLGHVYHWHIVTAAMQMTMFNTFPTTHPIYQLLAPQSKFAIPFDNVLLLLWSQIAPPTSLSTFPQFLELANDYAAGRSYFDDDPLVTLAQLGIHQSDFTIKTPWDQYPVVQRLLNVWNLATAYVNSFVQATYKSDAAVAADTALQTWIAMSSATDQGNIRGLPKVNTRAALEKVLTSLLYRITVHGISRMNATANPSLTFTPNFPHCLQRTDIPPPNASISTETLLSYLPNTETIGEAINFYFIFVFSPPYELFVPLGGTNTELFFPGGLGDARNQALIRFRDGLAAFINDYEPATPQRFQWPRNIET
jgi:Lipoxygenase